MTAGHRNEQQRSRPAGAGAGDDWEGLKEEVGQIAETAVDRGRHFLDAAREQAFDFVDTRKDVAAQSVADLAGSLREACRAFDDRPNIRVFADSAADGLEQLAESIRERSFGELFEDVEQVMRRRPGTVAAATFALGFLAARFIKSSAESIRAAEQERRRSTGSRGKRRGSAARSGTHAQASPGSAYAQSSPA